MAQWGTCLIILCIGFLPFPVAQCLSPTGILGSALKLLSLKSLTHGKPKWVRSNFSTLTWQGLDTPRDGNQRNSLIFQILPLILGKLLKGKTTYIFPGLCWEYKKPFSSVGCSLLCVLWTSLQLGCQSRGVTWMRWLKSLSPESPKGCDYMTILRAFPQRNITINVLMGTSHFILVWTMTNWLLLP